MSGPTDGTGDSPSTIEFSLSLRQLVAVALVVGVLVGALVTAVGYSVVLLGGTTAAASGAGPSTGPSAGTATRTQRRPSTADDPPLAAMVEGVDSTEISRCMDRNHDQYLREARQDRREGSGVGIDGTPGFLVFSTGASTGTKIVGAQPYAAFREAIDAQLNGTGTGTTPTNVSTSGEPFVGSNDAPVTIVYWFDYQCPFCKRFEQRTFPRIEQNYVENGTVRIVFKDFPFLGADSQTAALASRCVWERTSPSVFEQWFRTVFDNQGTENSGWASKGNLVG